MEKDFTTSMTATYNEERNKYWEKDEERKKCRIGKDTFEGRNGIEEKRFCCN